jgi:hypothetical protein
MKEKASCDDRLMTQHSEIRVGNPSKYVARRVSGQQITRRSRGEGHVLRPKVTRCSRQLELYEEWIVAIFGQEVEIKPLMKYSSKDELSVYGDGSRPCWAAQQERKICLGWSERTI